MRITRACEQPDLDQLRAIAEPLGPSVSGAARAQIEALGWAEQVALAGG